jgi:hypothetical protein
MFEKGLRRLALFAGKAAWRAAMLAAGFAEECVSLAAF